MRNRSFWHRLRHWEYWPFGVVYLPMYFVWLWYALKAGRMFFFLPSNPGIRNAGFLMESKKEIYDALPAGTYPATLLYPPGTLVELVLSGMHEAGIPFPCIAKPDTGMQGLAVAKIRNQEELANYTQRANFDFLLQAFVPYEKEAGIFWYRFPAEASGEISGIVLKEFMTVQGDGVKTLRQLVAQNDRYAMQITAVETVWGKAMDEVVNPGKELILLPFGNHARGSKFIDGSDSVSPQLTEVINRICTAVPGFYYGRLDIRYRSMEALERGEDFSIIELNGAGSEPTHIYDPGHSIFFAWREIARHYRILYRISIDNARRGYRHMTFAEGRKLLSENKAMVKKLKAF